MLVWWSVLFVNLAGLRDAQVAGETSLLGVSVRVFPEDVSVRFSDAYPPPLSRGSISQSVGAQMKQKAEEGPAVSS